MKVFVTIFLVLVLPLYSLAQFSDSIQHHAKIATSGTLNKTTDGYTYLLNSKLNYSIRKQHFAMNASGLWIYGATPGALTNNDVTGALDFNRYTIRNPALYYWGLVNFTSSFSLKINEQVQTGVGLAYRFINKDRLKLNLSDGILFERSNITQPDSSELRYETFRNSLRLQFSFNYNDLITFSSSGFWQPSLQYASDYILTGNATLGFRIWRWISLTTSVFYNKVSRTQKETLLITYGLTFERYF